MTATRNLRRTLRGVVTSTSSAKTITVTVERTYRHPRYGKFVRKQKKYLAHDEKSEAQVGDQVEIVATRPLSKRKRWRLGAVLQKSDFAAPVEAEAVEELTRETMELTAGAKKGEAGTESAESPEGGAA